TLTRHPEKKKGVNISRNKYDAIRASIIECLQAERGLTYTELAKQVERTLQGRFEGSIRWYVEAVKLDLEARRIVERIPRTRPQLYRLTAPAD
ncbi:MAG: hypothetical protein ACE5KW_04605, partial [Dehalococcoidia bacterium]